MDREALEARLLSMFVEELEDHTRGLGAELLRVERGVGQDEALELVRSMFRRVHSLKGAARAATVPAVERLCHRAEELLAVLRDGKRPTDALAVQLLDAFAGALDRAGILLRSGGRIPPGTFDGLEDRLAHAAKSPIEGRTQLGAATHPVHADTRGPESAGTAAPPPPPRPPDALGSRVDAVPTASVAPAAFVRVRTEKLDGLVADSSDLLIARSRMGRLVGELAELESTTRRLARDLSRSVGPLRRMLAREGGRLDGRERRAAESVFGCHAELSDLCGHLQQLTQSFSRDREALDRSAARLEDGVRSAHMLPFSDLCLGLERAVRDLARSEGKEVELVVEVRDVELDRSVLEPLKDPLLHLVRNAVVHGIERPGDRRAAGKPDRGRVSISASLASGTVVIEVSDDGRGLDLRSLAERARERGFNLGRSARDLARLVFMPGISTSGAVTELSGRGVGLDVVKSRVEEVHGSIEVEHEPGRGTRFSLTVPLTLGLLRAAFISAGGQTFAIPSTSVLGFARIDGAAHRTVEGRLVLPHAGMLLPLVPLSAALRLRGPEPIRPPGHPREGVKTPVVLLSSGAMRVALMVDTLIAEQEIVMKPLGALLSSNELFAGGTITPSGRVVLVVAPAALSRAALSLGPGPEVSAGALEVAPPRPRLLVADDSLTTRTLEKTILESAGFQVTAAADGEEAWRLLEEGEFDLLVADVEMPRLDGLQLTRRARASRRYASLPVVLVTGLGKESDRKAGLDAGADAYLVKSEFDRDSLLALVRELVGT